MCGTSEASAITRVDMARTGYITARVEPKLKVSADRALKRVGVSTSDAISMFLRQVVLQKGLPFEVRMPNAETIAAMEEARDPAKRKKLKAYRGATKDIFDKVLGKGKKQGA